MGTNATLFDPLGADGIRALCQLLNPNEEDEDQEELNFGGHADSRNPGNICGGTTKARRPAKPYVKVDAKVKPQGKKKRQQNEKAQEEVEEVLDSRPPPEYEMLFQQTVMPEDIYLGISGKTPSSDHCDKLVVKVKLPNAELKDIKSDVDDDFLLVETPDKRLKLPLPYPVDPALSTAKWDPATYILSVTVAIKREVEYVQM